MYKKILVALENSPADRSLVPHVQGLAILAHSELLLLHVADGWAARNFENLKLAESEEMKKDRDYLEQMAEVFRAAGLKACFHLAMGDPATQILKTAEREHCDLIAMTSHGHKLIGDLVFGSTIHKVRHETKVPVLLIKELKP
jgi:nucleotide-binding universal stress UspA family protein